MDSTLLTAVILLGITFLCIFLFSLSHQRAKRKEAQERKAILAEAISANSLKITESEEAPHFFVGIDALKAQLLYIGYYEKTGKVELIDLKEIKSAKLDEVENQIYEERKGKSVIVERQVLKIQLKLMKESGVEAACDLPFYQMLFDSVDEKTHLKSRASHWQELVNNTIKQRKEQLAVKSR